MKVFKNKKSLEIYEQSGEPGSKIGSLEMFLTLGTTGKVKEHCIIIKF